MVKKILKLFLILFFIGISIPLVINLYVIISTKNNIITVSEASELEDVDCIIVLGAGLKAGKPSDMLQERLDMGVSLYQAVDGPKVLMSGDHETPYYDEVNVMKKYAVEKGVPSKDVFMDHAGLSTYDSIKRVKEVFKAKKIIIVTQKYHLYRAMYIASQLGMEAYGVNATKKTYPAQMKREIREVLARIKDVYMVVSKQDPTHLGKEISFSGDGNETNDKYVLISSIRDADERYTGVASLVEQIDGLVKNGKYKKATCDGKASYTMQINAGEIYAIELFSEEVHIRQGSRELSLTREEAKVILDLIGV